MHRGSAKIEFDAYVSEHTAGFVGRAWCFDAIEAWLAEPTPRTLLITGEPGSGKTAILGKLFERSAKGGVESRSGLGEGFVSAAHFCSARDHRWTDPIAFVKSVALQLSATVPDFAQALLEEADRDGSRLSVEQKVTNSSEVVGIVIEELTIRGQPPRRAFTELLSGPLSRVLGNGSDATVLLLVDAVDESRTGRAGDDIAALLAGIGQLPANLRLIVSSRPDGEFRRTMERLGAEVLNLSTAHDTRHLDDVKLFVESRLTAEQRDRIDPGVGVGGFVNLCAERADGNLLHARQILTMLDQSADRTIGADSVDKVSGLDGVYFEYLDRLRGVGVEWERIGPLVGALTVAFAAPTEAELAGWLGASRGTTRRDLAAIDPLLEDDHDGAAANARRLALYHRSFADFLLDEDRAGGFWCPAVEQHGAIASSYLRRYRGAWEKCDSYGLTHLPRHLAAAEENELLLQALDVEFFVAKAERAESLRPVLDDLRLGLRAALDLGPGAPALRMMLSQALLNERIRGLPRETLALLAGAGEVDRALELTAMLDDRITARLEVEALVRQVLERDPARAMTIAQTISEPGTRACAEVDVRLSEVDSLADDELRSACKALAEPLERLLTPHAAALELMRLARAAKPRDPTLRGWLLGRAEKQLVDAKPTLSIAYQLRQLARAVAADEPGRAQALFTKAAHAACAEGENEAGAMMAGECVVELGRLDPGTAAIVPQTLPTTIGKAHGAIRLIELADSPEQRARFRSEAIAAIKEIRLIAKAEAPRWLNRAHVWLSVTLEEEGGIEGLPDFPTDRPLGDGLLEVLSRRRFHPTPALALATRIDDLWQRDRALGKQAGLHLDDGDGGAALRIARGVIQVDPRVELTAKAGVAIHRASPGSAKEVFGVLEEELRSCSAINRFTCAKIIAETAPENARRLFDAGIGQEEVTFAESTVWMAAAEAALAIDNQPGALEILRAGLRDQPLRDWSKWRTQATCPIFVELARRAPQEAFELRDRIEDPTLKLRATGAIAEGLAESDPDGALALLDELAGDDSQGTALAAIVVAAAECGDPRTVRLMERFLAWEEIRWMNTKGDVAARAATAICPSDPNAAATLAIVAAEESLSDWKLVARALRRLVEQVGTGDAVIERVFGAITCSEETTDRRWLVPYCQALMGAAVNPIDAAVPHPDLEVEPLSFVLAAKSVAAPGPEGDAWLSQARELAAAVSPTWERLSVQAFIVEILTPGRPRDAVEVAKEILAAAEEMESPHDAVGPICDAATALVGAIETRDAGLDCLTKAFEILGGTYGVDAELPVEDCLAALERLPLPLLARMLPPFLESAQTASDAVLDELDRFQRLLLRVAGDDWDPEAYLRDVDFAESVATAALVA